MDPEVSVKFSTDLLIFPDHRQKRRRDVFEQQRNRDIFRG